MYPVSEWVKIGELVTLNWPKMCELECVGLYV